MEFNREPIYKFLCPDCGAAVEIGLDTITLTTRGYCDNCGTGFEIDDCKRVRVERDA